MRGFRVPNSPPTGCNSVRKPAATAAIQKEGKPTWQHQSPRKDHWLTLTLPPPALSSWLCSHGAALTQTLEGSLLQVGERHHVANFRCVLPAYLLPCLCCCYHASSLPPIPSPATCYVPFLGP